jgi:hypothetical protein
MLSVAVSKCISKCPTCSLDISLISMRCRQAQAQLIPTFKAPDYTHTTPRHQSRQHSASASMPSTPAGGHLSTFQMQSYSYQPVHQPINGRFPGGVASPTPSQSPRIPQGSASLGVQTGDIRGSVLPSGFVPLQAVSTTEVRILVIVQTMNWSMLLSRLQHVASKNLLHSCMQQQSSALSMHITGGYLSLNSSRF